MIPRWEKNRAADHKMTSRVTVSGYFPRIKSFPEIDEQFP